MKFSKGTSYNTHDAKVTIDERICVTFNVRKRCDLVMRAILRFGTTGVDLNSLTDHLNKRLNSFYSNSDIGYACKRLARDGFIKVKSRDCFVVSPRSAEAWKKVPTELI